MRVVLALLLVELSLLSSPAGSASLSEAQSLYSRNQVADATAQYRAIAVDSAVSKEDRSIAERELGRIAWLIEGDAGTAIKHIMRARDLGGPKSCAATNMLARVLQESERYEELIRREAELLDACDRVSRKDAIQVRSISARLGLAAKQPGARDQILAAAKSAAASLTPEAGVDGARVRLEIAVLLNDPDAAMRAWKDYFWLDEQDDPQALEGAGVTSVFNAGLRPNATTDDRLKLADLLMRTGFSEVSRRYALANRMQQSAVDDSRWKRLEAYWQGRDKFDATVLAMNRDLARAAKSDQSLAKAAPIMESAAKQWLQMLASAASGPGEPQEILKRDYGMIATTGTTSGYPSGHVGHLVEDRDQQITQYGKTANIHFMVIDNMITNGFESWLWDGGPMVGGWNSKEVIVQVRPAYVGAPLGAFEFTRPGEARDDLIKDEAKSAKSDIAKLRARPVATLDALDNRLKLQLIDQIWAGARSKARDEADVRRLFLAEYARANLHQSITVHEGRHAIDALIAGDRKIEQPVLEYTAKLSELALTAYPRMALANMNLNLEGEGPHDRAGAKVFDEFRKWIEANPVMVMGYDPAIPALAQIDKLSDSQIAEIARSLDPLANGRPLPDRL